MQDNYDVLIIGAGHAGAALAIALRQRKFAGSIGLVGDERHPPYERPPLSKDYLAGKKPFERLLIRPEAFWAAQDIELLCNRRVVRIDAEAHTVDDSGWNEHRLPATRLGSGRRAAPAKLRRPCLARRPCRTKP